MTDTEQTEVRYVRIKPYDARKGYLRRRTMIEGVRFDVDRGWYKIADLDFAERLADELQDPNDPESKYVFDVCTKEEAQKIDARERGRTGRSFVEEADASGNTSVPRRRNDMTTEDVKTRRGGKAKTEGWPEDMADPKSPKMIDPDPDGKELDAPDPENGKASAVGKLEEAKPRRRGTPRT